jgi:addiction module HigA family antidote
MQVICPLAPHPGPLIRQVVLPALRRAGVTNTRLAELLEMDRSNLNTILNGDRAITPTTALLLGKLLGGESAEHWMILQARHDLSRERRRMGDKLDQIQTIVGEDAEL